VSAPEVFKKRRRKLLELVKEDSVLVSEPLHIFYLTGLKAALEPWEGVLLRRNPMFLGISRNESMFLLVGRSSLANPFLTDELLFDSKSLFEGSLWMYGDYDVNERVVPTMDFVAEELSEVMEEMKSRAGFALSNVGIEEWHIQHEVTERLSREFASVKFSGISAVLRKMRETKDETEVKCIREGMSRLKSVLNSTSSLAVPGQTELKMLENLSRAFRDEFGEESSLGGQVLSGRRTNEVFGEATGKKLENGDCIILDLRTNFGGYWARESTTVLVGGNSTSKGDFDGLELALERGSEALVVGARAGDVFTAISDNVQKVGDQSSMAHEAGNGIGLELREDPFILPGSKEELREGMIIILSAGSYARPAAGARFTACYHVGRTSSTRL
jgi:Xaa-Pro aminopeptidase